MKLIEALEILRNPPDPVSKEIKVFLATGFTPLHLDRFLAAWLQLRFPDARIISQQGLYGDIVGNIERIKSADSQFGVVVLEWSDFDPRLGIRRLGGWSPDHLPDILASAQAQAITIGDAIEEASDTIPISVCLPTLPIPPISYSYGGQASSFDIHIRENIAALSTRLADHTSVKIINSQRLDILSPLNERLDVKSELQCGFPYKLPHASIIAELLVAIMAPPTAKKGLVIDLDDTLWKGILGEVGSSGISWDLDNGSQIHGIFQQLIDSLAETGILIGVSSKNDPALVGLALQRKDLLVSRERLYPLEIGWGPKSESLTRILNRWNIGADSVVFVDDSLIEIAEVKSAHPEVECLQFPTDHDQEAFRLLEQLRDLFGKEHIVREDLIRSESIRQVNTPEKVEGTTTEHTNQFLRQAVSEINVNFLKKPLDSRAFELVNKTNQFNLNGKRWIEAEWRNKLQQSDSFLMIVDYQDKFGPLGKIAVLSGTRHEKYLYVDTWAMSCRAFSRRIEHKCVDILFKTYGVEEIRFNYQITSKNSPIQEFFAHFTNEDRQERFHISHDRFYELCPPLFHKVKEPMVV